MGLQPPEPIYVNGLSNQLYVGGPIYFRHFCSFTNNTQLTTDLLLLSWSHEFHLSWRGLGGGDFFTVSRERTQGRSTTRRSQHFAAVPSLGIDAGEHHGGVGHCLVLSEISEIRDQHSLAWIKSSLFFLWKCSRFKWSSLPFTLGIDLSFKKEQNMLLLSCQMNKESRISPVFWVGVDGRAGPVRQPATNCCESNWQLNCLRTAVPLSVLPAGQTAGLTSLLHNYLHLQTGT